MWAEYSWRGIHPVIAAQLTYANIESIAVFMREHGGATAGLRYRAHGPVQERGISIGTLHGIEDAHVGDWIIRGPLGEFTICATALFSERYEAVLETPLSTHH
jgi:hypothetical protein